MEFSRKVPFHLCPQARRRMPHVSSTIAKATLEAIDERIAQRGLLQHPFYQSWTKGELTLPVLRDYAQQYYHHVAAFPTYLSALHSHQRFVDPPAHPREPGG
jgi:pyrroloquinoline quinone (PQQ) biosynthesis protein C